MRAFGPVSSVCDASVCFAVVVFYRLQELLACVPPFGAYRVWALAVAVADGRVLLRLSVGEAKECQADRAISTG